MKFLVILILSFAFFGCKKNGNITISRSASELASSGSSPNPIVSPAPSASPAPSIAGDPGSFVNTYGFFQIPADFGPFAYLDYAALPAVIGDKSFLVTDFELSDSPAFYIQRFDAYGNSDFPGDCGGDSCVYGKVIEEALFVGVSKVLAKDNYLYVLGTAYMASGNNSFFIAKVGVDGEYDLNFGPDGMGYTLLPIGSADALISDYANSMTITDDSIFVVGRNEKIIFGGPCVDPDSCIPTYVNKMFVTKFSIDGVLSDDDFGIGGRVEVAISDPETFTTESEGTTILVTADGNILVGGSTGVTEEGTFYTTSMALVRLTPDGTLDPTFYANGTAVFKSSSYLYTYLTDMVLLSDNRALIVGAAINEIQSVSIVARIPLNVTLSAGGEGGGIVGGIGGIGPSVSNSVTLTSATTLDFHPTTSEYEEALNTRLAPGEPSRVIISGVAGESLYLAKLDVETLTLDTTFGDQGRIVKKNSMDDVSYWTGISDFAFDSEGNIVFSGFLQIPVSEEIYDLGFYISRVLRTGQF